MPSKADEIRARMGQTLGLIRSTNRLLTRVDDIVSDVAVATTTNVVSADPTADQALGFPAAILDDMLEEINRQLATLNTSLAHHIHSLQSWEDAQ